jgi:hypothetical protein
MFLYKNTTLLNMIHFEVRIKQDSASKNIDFKFGNIYRDLYSCEAYLAPGYVEGLINTMAKLVRKHNTRMNNPPLIITLFSSSLMIKINTMMRTARSADGKEPVVAACPPTFEARLRPWCNICNIQIKHLQHTFETT